MDPAPLTEAQIASYQQNGFLILEPSFSAEELAALRLAADQLLARSGPIVQGNPRIEVEPETLDGQSIVRKIEPIIDLVPALEDLVYDRRLTAPAAQLFGAEVVLFEDKLNYKPPLIGSAYPLHQDYSYWTQYTDQLITVTLHLDAATQENGCLRFVPGSHRNGLVDRPTGDPHIIAWEIEDPTIAVDALGEAGSIVLFSGYTAHHSFANRSDQGRRAVLYTYNPVAAGDTYPIYKGAAAQRCLKWLADYNNGNKAD